MHGWSDDGFINLSMVDTPIVFIHKKYHSLTKPLARIHTINRLVTGRERNRILFHRSIYQYSRYHVIIGT